MGSQTWGTGTDIFAVDYLDTQVPNSGSSQWQSSDIYAHMLSALELKRMSGHFEAGVDTTTGSSTPADTPLSLVTEGASSGYYRTIKYASQTADNYFFSQNILMYDRHIITNVSDIQRIVWKPTITENTFSNVSMVDGTTRTIKCYSISQFEENKVDILKKGKTDEYTTTGINVVPAIISPDSTNHLQGFNYWSRVDEYATWLDRTVYRYNQTYGSGANNTARYCPVFGNQSGLILPNSANETSKWAIDDSGNYAVRFTYKAADQYSYLWTTYCNVKYWVCTEDELLHVLARSGVKFVYNNTMYKPVAENGVITGYTDDMDEESEWDNWHDYTDHEIPVTPPSPTPSGGDDDIDSMGFDGMSCSVGGPAKYYIMSYNDIHHLIGDFNAHAEPGTSISNNIISCYINALDWNWSTGSEAIQIFSGGAQTTAFTSDMNYAVLSGYNKRDIIGSIDVPRMTNTFYDFSPYSTYEVYVPFCGWVALPDTVAGRNIKIYFETDEATCGCKGRVFFVDSSGNGVTVAEITGSFGAPCPIQVIEGGLYKQAMLSNGLQVIGGIASGVMGGAMGAGALAVSGFSSAMQSLGNCLIAGNTNYGQTIGRAGDVSGLMCAGKPYLKITYPPVDEVVNNSMFGHTVGYLCNEVGVLDNYHGFTVCLNPHITGIDCTDEEKEEIKRLLEDGVIL